MAKKITIIGGGSSTFTPQLVQSLIRSEALRSSTLSLMDVDTHRLKIMDTLGRQLVNIAGAGLRIETTTDQRKALEGADFVITTISVGGNDAWEKDLEIPASYGIFMPVADSIGPGGMQRAFRHIPVLAGVVRDLERLSPQAWVFNYSNPVSANCIAMRKAAPSIRTIGLCSCSSIPRKADFITRALKLSAEPVVPPPCAGLNHCAAMLQLKLKDGRDAFPLIQAPYPEAMTRWVLETYGIIPYCGSHWVEFFPTQCRLAERYQGRAQGLRLANGVTVHDMKEHYERVQKWEDAVAKLARGEDLQALEVLPAGEAVEVVNIMETLVTGRQTEYVLNLPNGGAIPNLPADAIVEVSALVDSYGVHPLQVGPLPGPLAALLCQHAATQQTTAEAALTGNYRLALHAYLEDVMTSTVLTPPETEKLLNELLKAHAAHLPQFA